MNTGGLKGFIVGMWSGEGVFRMVIGGLGVAMMQGAISFEVLGGNGTVGMILNIIALAVTAGDKNTPLPDLKKKLKEL